MQIVFKDDNGILGDYYKQIVDKKFILKAGSYTPLISINMSEPRRAKNGDPQNIIAEIYASKSEKSYKLLLKTVKLEERIKKKQPNKFIKNFGILFEKITSRLPAFLF